MISKMTYLTHANTIIAPSPDFAISFISESKRTVIVQCPELREMWEVAEYVKRQRSGAWMAGFWQGEADNSNPFMNGAGMWCYLLEQA